MRLTSRRGCPSKMFLANYLPLELRTFSSDRKGSHIKIASFRDRAQASAALESASIQLFPHHLFAGQLVSECRMLIPRRFPGPSGTTQLVRAAAQFRR